MLCTSLYALSRSYVGLEDKGLFPDEKSNCLQGIIALPNPELDHSMQCGQ